MDIRLIDPRDVSWEIWDPTFRVYFWEKRDIDLRAAELEGIDPASVGYASYEYEIRGGDVHQVVDWATDTAAREGKTYTLYLVIDIGGEKGRVHLAGDDPTRVSG